MKPSSIPQLVDRIEAMIDHLQKMAGASVSTPGGVELTNIEWDIFENHLDPADYDNGTFKDPGLVLSFLKEKAGYERLKEGAHVQVTFRQNDSDPYVRFLDTYRGLVVGVTDAGDPVVQFSPHDWNKAIERSRNAGKDADSPFESQTFDYINAKKRTVKLSALDIREYRKMLRDHNLVPSVRLAESRSADEAVVEKQSYLYDPLVTDLLGVSKQQLLYILRNKDEILPEYSEDEDDETAPVGPNPVEGSTEKVAKITRPSREHPLAAITTDKTPLKAKRLAIWKSLWNKKEDGSPSAGARIDKIKGSFVWVIASNIYANAAIAQGVIPFPKWTKKQVAEFVARRNKRLEKGRKKALDSKKK